MTTQKQRARGASRLTATLTLKAAQQPIDAADRTPATRAQSIAGSRLTASGRGHDSPVGDSSSATGRQQNRRVEVIITPPLVSTR